MFDRGRRLAEISAAAWDNYDRSVKAFGSFEDRRFAADAAFDADERLAAHEWSQRPKADREKAMRALSGA